MNPRRLIELFFRYRGRAIFSLVLIYLSVLTGWYWLWGVLLLYWVANDLLFEQTWLSEVITRRSNPLLYHLILFTWLVFGFYLTLYPFIY